MTARGVTLVEVTVVILVIGLAAAVATPRLPDFGTERNDAVERVLGVLEEARRQAARRGRPVEVDVTSGGRYEIRLADEPGGAGGDDRESMGSPGTDRAEGDPGRVLATGPFPAGVEVMADPRDRRTSLRFGPRGRAAGPDVRVPVGGGRSVTLAVRPWSGRVVARR